MADIIIIVIIGLCLGAAVTYIIKQKKRGAQCIGCPDGGCCSKSGTGGCHCGSDSASK